MLTVLIFILMFSSEASIISNLFCKTSIRPNNFMIPSKFIIDLRSEDQKIVKSKTTHPLSSSLFGFLNFKADEPIKNQVIDNISVDWDELKKTEIIPILAFVNRKSGGKRGKEIIDQLSESLSIVQICDITSISPRKYLELYKNCQNDIKILCYGGDGTIRWIMDEVIASGIINNNRNISYGIIPLGTGNDLYKHLLNSNNITSQQIDKFQYLLSDNSIQATESILNTYQKSNSTSLDRWNLQITRTRKLKSFLMHLLSKNNTHSYKTILKTKQQQLLSFVKKSIPLPVRISFRKLRNNTIIKLKNPINKLFNNYLGIGIDGIVTMKFATFRRKYPIIFFNQLINQIWYAIIGFLTFLFYRRLDLYKTVEIYCDGNKCIIPDGTQGIIVSNIGSYAGGSKLWQPNNFIWNKQNSSDGIVEVSTIQSFHS